MDMTTVEPLEMIAYEQAITNQMNRNCDVVKLFSSEGTKEITTEYQTTEFPIVGTHGAPARVSGRTLPRQWDNCDNSPSFATGTADLVWMIAPTVIDWQVEQMKGGLMGDPVQWQMDNLEKDVMTETERFVCAGLGDAVLFNLAGAGTDNGDGTFTYPIENYGGISGQILGELVNSLNLPGTPVQAADAVGNAAGNANAVTILDVRAELGNEAIICDGDLAPGGATAAGWVVYRARRDAGGIQAAGEACRGLPYLIADWQDYSTVEGFTRTAAPTWQSRVIRSPGAPVPINNALWNRILSMGEVSMPQDPNDGKTPVLDGFLLTHTFNVNQYGGSLSTQQQVWTPPLRNVGVQGYEKKYLSYNGIPICGANMAQRNTAYYARARQLFWRKNGPFWGQWMAIGGVKRFSRPCSPDQEIRWVKSGQLVVHGRAGMVRHDNLDAALPDAA